VNRLGDVNRFLADVILPNAKRSLPLPPLRSVSCGPIDAVRQWAIPHIVSDAILKGDSMCAKFR